MQWKREKIVLAVRWSIRVCIVFFFSTVGLFLSFVCYSNSAFECVMSTFSTVSALSAVSCDLFFRSAVGLVTTTSSASTTVTAMTWGIRVCVRVTMSKKCGIDSASSWGWRLRGSTGSDWCLSNSKIYFSFLRNKSGSECFNCFVALTHAVPGGYQVVESRWETTKNLCHDVMISYPNSQIIQLCCHGFSVAALTKRKTKFFVNEGFFSKRNENETIFNTEEKNENETKNTF